MAAQFRSSVLWVQDLARSRHFYEHLLGQRVIMDHGPNLGFEGGFALWIRDHAMKTVFETDEAPPGKVCTTLELYFEAEDLDEAASRLTSEGVPVLHGVREQPWGQRVIRVYDPDDYIVEIGEPLPAVVRRFAERGMAVEEIAARMSMPPEVVQMMGGVRV